MTGLDVLAIAGGIAAIGWTIHAAKRWRDDTDGLGRITEPVRQRLSDAQESRHE